MMTPVILHSPSYYQASREEGQLVRLSVSYKKAENLRNLRIH